MSWTHKRLGIFAAVILAAHVVAIFALHSRQPILERTTGSLRIFRLPPAGAKQPPTIEVNGLNDPLTFAGANAHGFSAPAWLTSPQMTYVSTNPIAPPKFLVFARESAIPPANQKASELDSSLPFLNFTTSNPPPKSTLAIEGGLARRPLVSSPTIPIQSATDVLSNTVVQAGVQANGFPLSLRIISSSGSRGADLGALQIANTIRFAAIPEIKLQDPNALQWGELVFQWFTVEPATTNRPPVGDLSAAANGKK
jgi:hypothetical protein